MPTVAEPTDRIGKADFKSVKCLKVMRLLRMRAMRVKSMDCVIPNIYELGDGLSLQASWGKG
jgi:hypothetical protein